MTDSPSVENSKTRMGDAFKNDSSPSRTFGDVRKEYEPIREELKRDLMEAGADENTSPFRKILRKLARKNILKDREALVDELTGLYNKRGFEKRFQEELDRAKRYGENLVIVNLDANRLKLINDAEGHQAGDELIQDVANLLKRLSRSTDVVGRVGGDEYRVLLTHTDLIQASGWAKRFVETFKHSDVHVSMGAALLDPNNPAAALEAADKYMYEVKEQSRTIPGAHYTDGSFKAFSPASMKK